MKIGDAVEILIRTHSIQVATKEKTFKDEWLPATVTRVRTDDTIEAKINQDGHKFHEAILTADAEYYRISEKAEQSTA
jgi:hypothetical protein